MRLVESRKQSVYNLPMPYAEGNMTIAEAVATITQWATETAIKVSQDGRVHLEISQTNLEYGFLPFIEIAPPTDLEPK